MRLVLLFVLIAVPGFAGCAGQKPPAATTDGQSSRPPPTGSTTRLPVMTVGPRTPLQPNVSSVPPLSSLAATRPDDPAVFASASAVSVEWLRQWCVVDWREPMNANLDRASRFQTAAAIRADRKKGDDENTYRAAQAQQLSSGCDEISATRSPEAPHGADVSYLVLSARRVDSVAGTAFQSERVQSVRRIVRQTDGRWLVDEEVEAG